MAERILGDEHEFTLGKPQTYGKQDLPFIGLAASLPNNNVETRNQRNSFDFLEMESNDILEMTGDNFSRFLNSPSKMRP